MAKRRIANNVRQYRFSKGEMTQQELADRIGCTRQTIIMLEQGRYVPSLALALAIAMVFECSVEDLFQLQDD